MFYPLPPTPKKNCALDKILLIFFLSPKKTDERRKIRSLVLARPVHLRFEEEGSKFSNKKMFRNFITDFHHPFFF